MSTSTTINENMNIIEYTELLSTDNKNKSLVNILKKYAENNDIVEVKQRVFFILGVELSFVT